MIISVDPDELLAASGVLRGCSSEAADIGSQLWSCVGCQMPGEIRAMVDEVVAAADRALDAAGAQLSFWAGDLANRAQIARTDSLTAASLAVAPVPPSVTGTMAGGGAPLIGGGYASGGVTVFDPGAGPVVPNAGLIGGGYASGGVTVFDPGAGPVVSSAGLIGGGYASGGVTVAESALGLGASAGLVGGGQWKPTLTQLVGAGYLGNPTTPFLGGGGRDGSSYLDWANDLHEDSDNDGYPNGADNYVRDPSRH